MPRSSDKGKRVERELCAILTKRFGQQFSRTIGSGNRWGSVSQLPKHAQETFSGDIVCPTNFLYVIECKGGYDDIDVCQAICEGNAQLDAFFKQAVDEGVRTRRMPLLAWKRTRRPWLAFIRDQDSNPADVPLGSYIAYGRWRGYALQSVLKLPDKCFFFARELAV